MEIQVLVKGNREGQVEEFQVFRQRSRVCLLETNYFDIRYRVEKFLIIILVC